MAYSGKQTITGQQNNFVSAFTNFFRFICGDPNTPGRDWQIVYTNLDSSPNSFTSIAYSGSITVNALNSAVALPTGFVSNYTFTNGSTTLVEGTDYSLDWKLGYFTLLKGSVPATINYSYNFKRYQIVVRNTGLDGQSQIDLGFLMLSTGLDKANIVMTGYRRFDVGVTNFFDTTGNLYPLQSSDLTRCSFPAFGYWTGDIYQWIFSNKQRIIIVVRNNTYYSFGYAGYFMRVSLPSEYPTPLWIYGDLWTGSDITNTTYAIYYDSTLNSWPSAVRTYIAQPFTSGFQAPTGTNDYGKGGMINYANQWSRRYRMIPTEGPAYFYDGSNYYDPSSAWYTWATVAYQSGYNNVLLPLYLFCDEYISGFPDGCYHSPGFALQSENEITVGNDTYIIFQNCFRTTYDNFMAIKEA
jgi:hypothetical protein